MYSHLYNEAWRRTRPSSAAIFQLMDRALQGELVEITYRGAKLRLTPPPGTSKLAPAVRRHALRADPASIVESDAKLMAELDRKWKRDDSTLWHPRIWIRT